MSFLIRALAPLAVAVLPGIASAHTFGAHDTGFTHGFLHPVGGWDHLLAMVAVGLWAVQRRGAAVWVLPLTFVSAMVAGGALAMEGIGVPQVEPAILASVIVLGALIAAQAHPPLAAAAGVVALFALFHGHAHGGEMPEAADPFLYALGFVLATALLHGGGVAAALAMGHRATGAAGALTLRGTGAAVALGGVTLALVG